MKNPNNRPLGTNEKVFWALDQKSSTHFAVAAELLGNASEGAWRAAIDTVQLRHPNLSVRISGNEYRSTAFEGIGDCRIPLRIIHTGLGEDWAAIVEGELNEAIDLSVAPLVRTVLVQQPGKTVFIFVANHSISDGMSVALVIRDILNVISGQSIGNLSPLPSLDGVIGLDVFDNQAQIFTEHHSIEKPLPREKTSIAYQKFSEVETNDIISRSRLEQTTVHGTLGAALVVAMVNEQTGERPIRIMHPVSARRTLNMGDDFSLLINIITSAYNGLSGNKFWDLAREVRASVATAQTAEWIEHDTISSQQLFNNNLSLETILQALAAGTEHEVMLTNLGELAFESTFGPLKLLHLWGPMVLTPHLAARTVGVATFNGKLTLTVTGLFRSPDLLERVRAILAQVCGSSADTQIGHLTQRRDSDQSR